MREFGSLPWHRRLEARVLGCLLAVVGCALAVSLMATDRIITGHSLNRAHEDLATATAVFYRLADERAGFAAMQSRLITELPVFRAGIDLGDPPTLRGMAEEYRGKLHAAFCLVTDGKGRWLGQPGWPAAPAPPAIRAGIQRALSGQSHWSYEAVAGRLYLVVYEPARFAEEVLGTLAVGYALDDGLAGALARTTGCEVGFLLDGRLCGTSLDRRSGANLLSALQRAGHDPQSETTSNVSPLWQLGTDRYVGGRYALRTRTPHSSSVSLVLLKPWRPTQAFLDQVNAALLAAFGIILGLALVLGVLFSRRLTRPLREIAAVAEALAGGEWQRRAPEGGPAEIDVLAFSFNRMTVSLQHWHHEARSHAERLAETLTQLQEAHAATLQALSRALDARDNETEGHSQRVSFYAMALADAMGLGEEERAALHWGALLHDIGKIGVPDAILHKPGGLDPEELRMMRRHCEFGLEIVRGIPYLERAASVIGGHHERYDGTGYPRGLSGEAIPRVARIFAVADTLDALTSDRPYRQGCPFDAALAEIARHAGTQFDPAVVAALPAILDELAEWRAGASLAPPARVRLPDQVSPSEEGYAHVQGVTSTTTFKASSA